VLRPAKILLSLGLFILFNLNYSAAQVTQSISATGHVFAEVIPVFSAREIAQLNFGRFSPGPQGGKIVLSPQNTIQVQGSVFLGTGLHNSASYYVTGDENASYSISLPEGPVILNHTASAKTMTIEEWNSFPSPGIGTGMLQNGFQVVSVGATLNIGTLEDNPVGIYTGTYTITFDFN
jgi:hypothetical protein